jgi:hypothetical protein
MWIRKAKAGSCGYRGGQVFEWKNNGDVIEVPDDLGESLLDIPGGGFSEVDEPPKAAKGKAQEPETHAEDGEQAEEKPAKRAYRRRTAVEE